MTADVSGLGTLPEPRALVFDLDGTLVDTVAARIDGWLETFQELGIPAHRERVAALIGSDGRRLAREVAGAAGRALTPAETEWADRRAGELYDRHNTHPRPLPGVRELLLALGSGSLPWAVATSSRAEQVLVSVAALRLQHAPLIVDGSHVEHAKPAPDLLLLAADRLAAEPPACWYIGDATWDVLAATAAGMPSVAVATGAVGEAALRDAGASAAIPTLEPLHAELARRRLLEPPRSASAAVAAT